MFTGSVTIPKTIKVHLQTFFAGGKIKKRENMKQETEIFIDASNPSFDGKDEYGRINDELLDRIRSLFSQGHTFLALVGAIWTIAAATWGVIFQNITTAFSKENILWGLVFNFFVMFLFGLPSLLSFPFSIKHHDNLRAVVSLSAYIKVFYEAPAIFPANEDSPRKRLLAWESLHCDAKLSKTRFFHSEYIIATLGADIIAFLCSIVSLCNLISFEAFQKHLLASIVFVVVSVLYIAIIIFLTVHVWRYSRVILYMKLYGSEYVNSYLRKAVAIKHITPEQADRYANFTRNQSMDDDILTLKLNKKLKTRHRILKESQKRQNELYFRLFK